jgi:hypothetical protein
LLAGDRAEVRRSAAAMEDTVRSCRQRQQVEELREWAGGGGGGSARLQADVGRTTATSALEVSSAAERELVQRARAALAASERIDSSARQRSGQGSGGAGGAALLQMSRQLLPRSGEQGRVVRRKPATAVRWLETSWSQHSVPHAPAGVMLMHADMGGSGIEWEEEETDLEEVVAPVNGTDDDAASFVDFVRQQTRQGGTAGGSSLTCSLSSINLGLGEEGEEGFSRLSLDSTQRARLLRSRSWQRPRRRRGGAAMAQLPANGSTRREVHEIGRDYLAHCHATGPLDRSIRRARRRGSALMAQGRLAEAIAVLERGMVAAEERGGGGVDGEALPRLLVQARGALGGELRCLGRASEALRLCTRGLRIAPDDPRLQAVLDEAVRQVDRAGTPPRPSQPRAA